MKKAWLLLLCVWLMPVGAQAQTIRGTVMEDETRAPIAGAFVELLAQESGPVASAHTDSVGRFVLSLERGGSYVLRVRHLAFASVDSVELSLQRGEQVQIELRMARTAIPLEPLVVTTRRSARLQGFYDRMQRPGFGRFISREQIENRPGTRTTDLLRGMPGIHIVQTSRGGMTGANLITMRGGTGRCLPTLYIDGMEVRQFPESGADEFISPTMLEGVEVYTGTGGIPGAFPTMNGCGVVAFWTRTDTGRPWSWRRLLIGGGLFTLLVLIARR